MPELPEVEDARRKLSRWLCGTTIVSARAFDARIVRPRAPATLARDLRGCHVERVERRGKWLRIVLSGQAGQAFLFSHLGMTGDWRRVARDEKVRWERARLDVSKRGELWRVSYADPRKFGRLVFAREDIPSWRALGPDPLEHGNDVGELGETLARRGKRSIKEALMDQAVLAGVGNIQATEALWRARIDPRSRAGALAAKDVAAVVRALRWTIERTLADLEKNGGWLDDDSDPFVVYGHKGQPCPRCKTTLERVTLGGRTTTYCPGCQRRMARF
jgi:formamidopyrimidine-DNA glycosylase